MDISLEEVEEIAGGAIIPRPHFAQALVRQLAEFGLDVSWLM